MATTKQSASRDKATPESAKQTTPALSLAARLALMTATCRAIIESATPATSQAANQTTPPTSQPKSIPFRNLPKVANRKEPAAYQKIKVRNRPDFTVEKHAAKSARLSARIANLAAAATTQPPVKPPAKPATTQPAPVEQSTSVTVEAFAGKHGVLENRRKLRRQASLILKQAAIDEAKAKQAALSPQLPNSPEYNDILAQLAGYDPNAVQGPNDVIFRPKGGGRPNKTTRRHYVLNQVERNEEMQDNDYGRQCLRAMADDFAESVDEVVSHTGIDYNINYVHRPVGQPINYRTERELHNLQFPQAAITDDEVREYVGLPTFQQELETTDVMRAAIANTFDCGAHL